MLSQSTRYYVPQPSTWPIFGSFALLSMALGAASWFNGVPQGKYLVFAGLAVLFYMLAGWFSTVAHESEGGSYNKQVDTSFRWGMGWFIFSEVMFQRPKSFTPGVSTTFPPKSRTYRRAEVVVCRPFPV